MTEILSTNLLRYVFACFIKMLQHKKVDVSEEINLDKTDKSKECMLCNYWYFLSRFFLKFLSKF